MSFFRDCWLSVRGNVRDCMTTPLSRKKLLIFGGVFLAVVLLVIILVFSLRSGGGGSSESKGSSVLNGGLAFGRVDSNWLKTSFMNAVSEKSTDIVTQLKDRQIINSQLESFIWTVGASDCAAATQKDAVSQTLEGIDAAVRMATEITELTVATTKEELQNAKSNSKVGMVIALDGGYTFDSRLGVLRVFYRLGARILTLTGNCATPWAGNASSTANLTDFGKSVVEEANRLGIVVDLAGSSNTTIETVLGSSKSPFFFNGVAAKDLTDNVRNLDNSTIELIGKSNSLVMVSFKCDLVKNKNGSCSTADVINHINLIASKSSRSNVGIAADFGDLTGNGLPSDLKNMTGLSNLFDQLHSNHGWSLDDLRGLAYNNFYNLITNAAESGDPKKKPIDTLEPENELSGEKPTSLVCYSDLSVRYPTAAPTPAPTAAPTTPSTAPPATPSTAPTPTTKA